MVSHFGMSRDMFISKLGTTLPVKTDPWCLCKLTNKLPLCHLKFDINDKTKPCGNCANFPTVQIALCKLQPLPTNSPLALMEKFKYLLPLMTYMAKESTILPLSKENHLQRCIILVATSPINNSQ
jgi:hypothetical protein